MKNLNDFLDVKLTDQLGVNCYKGIFKEVTKSFFKVICETENHNVAYELRERLGLQRGVNPVYEEKEFFLKGYHPDATRYEWNLNEKLYCIKNLAIVDMKLIESIPLIDAKPTNLAVKYNGLKKCLVLCNNEFIILADI